MQLRNFVFDHWFRNVYTSYSAACCTPLAVRGLSNCRKYFMLLSDRMYGVTNVRGDNSNCRATQSRHRLTHRGGITDTLRILLLDYVECTVINQLTAHMPSQGM